MAYFFYNDVVATLKRCVNSFRYVLGVLSRNSIDTKAPFADAKVAYQLPRNSMPSRYILW